MFSLCSHVSHRMLYLFISLLKTSPYIFSCERSIIFQISVFSPNSISVPRFNTQWCFTKIHSKSTWKPEEIIFPKEIIKSYFKENWNKGARCHINVYTSVQFHSLKVFQGWELFYKSLLVRIILPIMFTNDYLATNVKPDSWPLLDSRKMIKFTIFHGRQLHKYNSRKLKNLCRN